MTSMHPTARNLFVLLAIVGLSLPAGAQTPPASEVEAPPADTVVEPAEEVAPEAETAPAEEAVPAEEAPPAEEAASGEEVAPAEEAVAAAEGGETALAEEAAPAEVAPVTPAATAPGTLAESSVFESPPATERRRPRWHRSVTQDEGWATLSLGVQGFIRPQSDYDLFSEHNFFAAPTLALGADVWRPNARWALAAEASLGLELVRSRDLRQGSIDTRYKAWQPRIAALLRYRVRNWLSPYARVGGGVSVVGVQVRGQVPGPNEVLLDEPNVTYAFDLGLGVELRTGSLLRDDWAMPRLSLGLRIEAGCTLGPAVDIRPARQGTGSAAIDTHDAALGSLQRNAPYVLITGVVRL